MVPIISKLKYDCKIQSSMNENEMNFQYIEDLDVEFLNSSLELKETVLGLNENSIENPSSIEEKGQEVEKSSEGNSERITQTLEVSLLGRRKI